MVTDNPSNEAFARGDHVAVPWGLDVLEGIVVGTTGEGPSRRVVVSVMLPDAEGEPAQIVSLSPDALAHAADVASEHRPGAWLTAYRYEEEVRRALESLLQGSAALAYPEWGGRSDVEADILVYSAGHQLVIEAKKISSGRISQNVVDRLIVILRRLEDAAGSRC